MSQSLRSHAVGWSRRCWRAATFIITFALLNVAAARAYDVLIGLWEADLLLTKSFVDPNAPIRFDRSVSEHLDDYWRYLPNGRTQRFAIVVGMSQMYAINEPKRGQRTIVEHMDEALAPQGVKAFGLAAPNLDNEEALLYLLATATRPEGAPYAMVYGACFDKMRNLDVRPSLLRFLRRRPELQAVWREVAERYAPRYPRASEKLLATLDALSVTEKTAGEETFESKLRREVGRAMPVVHARQAINSFLVLRLYYIRNWALGIKTSSKRPIMGARYDINRDLLEIMAEEAQRREIKLLPYIIPLNRAAEAPYVESEYSAFKQWLQAFTSRRGLRYVDLDGAVPDEDWGLLDGQPDFKHFKAAGHARTAAALVAAFRDDLLEGIALRAP